MAISRMLQPRQNYGLGSFVKKAVGKVTKPFTKLSKKIVPKEIAGIMRVAAPFLPPQLRAAAYLMGTARQTGRISPIDLALIAAPRIGKMELPGEGRFAKFVPEGLKGQTVGQAIGSVDVPFTGGKDLREILVGSEGVYGPEELVEIAGKTTKSRELIPDTGTSGIFGKGEKMFQIGKDDVGILDTKAGQALFGKETKTGYKPSLLKIGGLGLSAYDYIKSAKTAEEAGQTLVDATGDPDSYQIGYNIFADLQPSTFDIPEQFRLPAAGGGLMRENYALGSRPTAQESGLGGLPIEADMRYTGGFMPYGAVEKADDVPARLSKNEFVFTADAVRAAGGGSVQKGAQKMYNTMKQLESQSEAKGMMA